MAENGLYCQLEIQYQGDGKEATSSTVVVKAQNGIAEKHQSTAAPSLRYTQKLEM